MAGAFEPFPEKLVLGGLVVVQEYKAACSCRKLLQNLGVKRKIEDEYVFACDIGQRLSVAVANGDVLRGIAKL
jgi:hypothetical protein